MTSFFSGVFVLAPAANLDFWDLELRPPHLLFCNVSSASCQWTVICLFALYSKAVYLEVLHDTPSCLGVPTGPEALRCEFVPHPGPQSPESRTSPFYVFAVVGDTYYNSATLALLQPSPRG